MKRSLADVSERVRNDSTSGASEILVSALRDLRDQVAGANELDREDLKKFALSLHRSKPAMAPIFNLSNSILCLIEDSPSEKIPTTVLLSLSTKMLRDEEAANHSIAGLANSQIDASRIITISYSSSVLGALKAMGKDRKLSVTVAESRPGVEGRRTAKIISLCGVKTELIPDSLVPSRAKDADAALVGADAVTTEGVVNKVGTYALALAAMDHEVPAYVLCSWSKLCPMVFEDLGSVEKRLGKNLLKSSQTFESTPLDYFHRFVTDRGVLRPMDVRSKLKDYRKALAW
jgi:translation initiation factor 2B subunit (eIF-2B alpha/beta/delta family)